MRIAGLQKLTLLDFPEHTAATVFLPGCNFRCPFCHNAALVLGAGDATGDTPVEEFFAFLDKRHGLLDGVCITGGEPLLQPELADFCARIKGAGFAVKLDTNGGVPGFDLAPVAASVDYLLANAVPYEFRTTVTRELHGTADLVALSRWIAGAHAWHLQSFVDADTVLAGPGALHAWNSADLEALLPELRQAVPNTQLRGV